MITLVPPSFTSLMLDMDPAGREGLVIGAAEDRVTDVALLEPADFAEPAILGRREVGAFFIASETEARGRPGAAITIGLRAEPTEPVGEARKGSSEGFMLADAESDCFAKPGALIFAGTTDILRVGRAAVVGLDDVDETKVSFEATGGGDVVDFFKVGALNPAGPFDPVSFAVPEPDVP